MIRRSGGYWTAVAVDEVLPVFFTKSRCAAQLLENAERSINSLLARFAAQLAQMFFRHASPSSAHSGAQISGINLPRKYRYQKRDQSSVCFREQLFGIRAQSIGNVRFAN